MSDDARLERFPHARRLRRNWIFPGICAGAFVAGCLFIAGSEGPGQYAPAAATYALGVLLAWMGGWLAPLALIRNAFPLSSATSLEATPETLMLASGETIPVDAIKEARLVPRAKRAGETVVELKLSRFETIAIAMPEADAARLMDVLGVGAGARRASFTIVIPPSTRLVWSLLLFGLPWFLYMLATAHGDVIPLFFVLPLVILPVCLVIAVVLGFLRGKVTVGADGFTTSWYGLQHHHRFASVEKVSRVEKGMGNAVVETFVHFAQRQLRLCAHDAPDSHADRGAETRALAATLEEAFLRWKRAPAVAEVGAHLGRGQRSAKEWLAGIDQLVRGGGNNYRVAAITPEILTEVAKGTESPADARIGAAAALLRLNADAHRSTVRIAAEACAEPRTRVALLELVEAEGDDERVHRALARVR